MEIVFVFIGIALGIVIGRLLTRIKNQEAESGFRLQLNVAANEKATLTERALFLKTQSEQLNLNLEKERKTTTELNTTVAQLKTINDNLLEKLSTQKTELEDLQNRFHKEFENLANKILDEKSAKFTEQNRTNLDIILNPLKEKIKDFEDKVERTYKAESAERISLKTEVKMLVEQNKQISEEANNLARALKGDKKKQGDWGENILQLILEKSGLKKGVHYQSQLTLLDEEGYHKRPDIIINLPDERNLVVDSKVTLNAYVDYCASDDDASRKILTDRLIASVNAHIKDLSSKNYQRLYQINAPDFVLLFIPLEGAFSLVLENDRSVFLKALEERNIVLVTPSTLLATLSTVSAIWKQENQKRNVLEIARQSGDLYDKFVGLVGDLIDVGKRMDTAKKSYEDAMNKLSMGHGNLVSRVESIRRLGAKASKQLPETILERAEENV